MPQFYVEVSEWNMNVTENDVKRFVLQTFLLLGFSLGILDSDRFLRFHTPKALLKNWQSFLGNRR